MTTKKEVTVIGLGKMGVAIARLFLQHGYTVNVWNRSPDKAAPLVTEGAVAATNVAASLAGSEVAIISVLNYNATNDILDQEAVRKAIRGKLLVQFTTGNPEDARRLAAWSEKYGAYYLDGAIQVAPAQMGQSDTPILISGPEKIYREYEPMLKVLGGGFVYLGEEASAANAMDLATLTALYGAIIGFFHGARVSEVENFDVARYAEIIHAIMPTFAGFLLHEGRMIANNHFSVTESPLKISVEATDRILQHAMEKKIHTGYPALMARLLKEADEAGFGDEELASVFKLLRQEEPGRIQPL